MTAPWGTQLAQPRRLPSESFVLPFPIRQDVEIVLKVNVKAQDPGDNKFNSRIVVPGSNLSALSKELYWRRDLNYR
jgi:hypothetical protein